MSNVEHRLDFLSPSEREREMTDHNFTSAWIEIWCKCARAHFALTFIPTTTTPKTGEIPSRSQQMIHLRIDWWICSSAFVSFTFLY